jgi:hypothetical protein
MVTGVESVTSLSTISATELETFNLPNEARKALMKSIPSLGGMLTVNTVSAFLLNDQYHSDSVQKAVEQNGNVESNGPI